MWIHIHLASGRSTQLWATPDSVIRDLKIAAAQSLGVSVKSLITSTGMAADCIFVVCIVDVTLCTEFGSLELGLTKCPIGSVRVSGHGNPQCRLFVAIIFGRARDQLDRWRLTDSSGAICEGGGKL